MNVFIGLVVMVVPCLVFSVTWALLAYGMGRIIRIVCIKWYNKHTDDIDYCCYVYGFLTVGVIGLIISIFAYHHQISILGSSVVGLIK